MALLVLAFLGAACTSAEPDSGRVASPSPAEPSSPTPSPPDATIPPTTTSERPVLPEPDAPLPADPGRLAQRLTEVSRALDRSIASWVREGDPSTWPPPRPVILQSLYQQRVYRVLARDPSLARATIRRLPADLRPGATASTTAAARIFSVANPVEDASVVRTRPPEPADVLLDHFRDAERRFGVEWEVLAAVAYVESKFGRVVSNSSAGAQGPMQFIPSTWAAYGLGGDVHDPRDAIMGAANYLSASGAPDDYRRALYAYNPLEEYVDAVLLYARQLRRDPSDYYTYYTWQVFVLTLDGDVRVTGPGL